jgi:hypothetical protein
MWMLVSLVLCGLSLSLTVSSVVAQGRIYKWVDANGRVHYSDAPTGQAEDIAAILPPAASFGNSSAPPADGPPFVPEETPSLPSTGESPPGASLSEEEPEIAPPAASETSLPPAGEPDGRETIEPPGEEMAEPTDSEIEETTALPAAAETFTFTAFDNFLPGGLAGEDTSEDSAPATSDNARRDEEGAE